MVSHLPPFRLTIPVRNRNHSGFKFAKTVPIIFLMWGWGVMNSVAIQEAANIRFPMENFIGVWWSGAEQDVLPAGDGSNGYKSLNFTGTGKDYPIYADIQKYLVDAGKNAGDGSSLGTVQYNRGLYAAMLAAEAAKESPGNLRQVRHNA